MPTCATHILYVDSDMIVEVRNLRNSVTGLLVTGATVTAELLDLADAQVTGATNPFTLTEISGTTGLYRGTLSNAFAIVAGTTYKLKLVINGGSGLLRTETILVEARDA